METEVMNIEKLTVADVGEKRIIAEIIRPLFSKHSATCAIGEDCAALIFPKGETVLLSTDRVPSDLIAFKARVLDYRGLGSYLAVLNFSDIASSGGSPIGLLLNFGLPKNMKCGELMEMCKGVLGVVEQHGAKVLGGDITDALELSISATAVGVAIDGGTLSRRGARHGDLIFIARPLGFGAAAIRLLSTGLIDFLSKEKSDFIIGWIRSLEPMVDLGKKLAASGLCSSCMDNTDGLGQSLTELSSESGVSFVIRERDIEIPDFVADAAKLLECDGFDLAFGAGADFSLVGTLRGGGICSDELIREQFGLPIKIIGYVEEGEGVWLEAELRRPLNFKGWDYFR
jgi:thiamine-monophosphate kinase